jgi:hypothetical protein
MLGGHAEVCGRGSSKGILAASFLRKFCCCRLWEEIEELETAKSREASLRGGGDAEAAKSAKVRQPLSGPLHAHAWGTHLVATSNDVAEKLNGEDSLKSHARLLALSVLPRWPRRAMRWCPVHSLMRRTARSAARRAPRSCSRTHHCAPTARRIVGCGRLRRSRQAERGSSSSRAIGRAAGA